MVERAHVMSPHDTWGGGSRGQSIGHEGQLPPCHPAGAAHATYPDKFTRDNVVVLFILLWTVIVTMPKHHEHPLSAYK